MIKYFSLLLLFTLTINSQNWIKVDSIFAPSGVTTQSFACPAFADMNGDGKPDLFLGSTGSRVDYFENISTGLPPKFQKNDSLLNSIYSSGAFINADYPALVDLDGDNDLDLVIGGYNGFQFFLNNGDSVSPGNWRRDTVVFAAVNTVIGTDPKPAFADLDGDGDYDLVAGIGESLFGGPTPGIMIGFRNNGSASSPQYVQDNSLVTGLPDVGLNAYPYFKDVDNDGDLDLTIGRDVQGLLHYKNTGTPQSPVWTASNSLVSGIAGSTYWNDPTWCDLDGDGDHDLIYGNADGMIIYYRNTGTPATPTLQIDNSYFRIIKLEGSSATASLADFDRDGDFDLLSGIWSGKFIYFRNTGSVAGAGFQIATTPFSGFSPGSYSYPVFGDIDGDGDPDIVNGVLNGKVYVYINNNYTSFTYNSVALSTVNVGGFASPALADLNGDGKIDVLVGAETGGNSRFYLNMGSNTFTQADSFMTGVTFYSNTRPTFADFDNDGDYDLVIGRTSGVLVCYRNTGTTTMPVWQREDALFTEVKVRQNAAPGFADLDGDGKKDLIVGEYNGNFSYYKNNMAITAIEKSNEKAGRDLALSQNYPNPVNPSLGTQIAFSLPERSMVTIQLFDILGKEIAAPVNGEYNEGPHSVTLNTSGFASGIYIYRLTTTGGKSVSKKMIVVD
ncbi:MAG: VCBS repeat-containing protein [Ignavibacteriaceae bacterium]|nr:VCBS repeat-containing protein [Ignavibacteriaceae bacterium]